MHNNQIKKFLIQSMYVITLKKESYVGPPSIKVNHKIDLMKIFVDEFC